MWTAVTPESFTSSSSEEYACAIPSSRAASRVRSGELPRIPRTGMPSRRRASRCALPTNPSPTIAASAFIVSADFDALSRWHDHGEGLLKVGDQVVGIFNSDREAYELFGDVHFLPQVGRDHGVRREHRNRDQRLHSAQAGS